MSMNFPKIEKVIIENLRKVINDNIPPGLRKPWGMEWQVMIVPFSKYPKGYRCDPKVPLPFAGFASQKNHIAVYHMGMYAIPGIYEWFVKEYTERVGKAPDLGKSCLRLRPKQNIPYDLIGELFQKITVDEWISVADSI
jgi:hypothetical protein